MKTFLAKHDGGYVNTRYIATTSSYMRKNGSWGVLALMCDGERIQLALDSTELELALTVFVPVQGYTLWRRNSEEVYGVPVIGLSPRFEHAPGDNDCSYHMLLENGTVHSLRYYEALQLPSSRICAGDEGEFADISEWRSYVLANGE